MIGIGPHILIDGCDNQMLDRIVTHVDRTKPAVINVFGASRWNQIPEVIDRLRKVSKDSRIVMRGWPSADWQEDGLSQRKKPLEIFEIKAPRHLRSWLISRRVTILCDNETGVGPSYGEDQAEFGKLAAVSGILSAIGRTSTGNPDEDQYNRLDPIGEIISEYPEFISWSPNEYDNSDPRVAGNPLRLLRLRDRHPVLKLPGKIHLGEYGFAKLRLTSEGKIFVDAGEGYASNVGIPQASLSERVYARWVSARWGSLYRQYGIPVSLFAYGMWQNGSYSVGEEFMDELEKIAGRGELDLPPNTTPVAEWVPARVRPLRPAVNVRSSPSTGSGSRVLFSLREEMAVEQDKKGSTVEGSFVWERLRFSNGTIGFVRSDVAEVTSIITAPPEGVYIQLPEILVRDEEQAEMIADLFEELAVAVRAMVRS